jgi:predicted nucleotide-binding protein
MSMAYPDKPKDQYEWLINQAERYIRARKVSDRSLKLWRNRAVDWLKQNSPKTYLARELLIVPIHSIQRGLKILLKAQPTIPFVGKTSALAPPHPSNTRRVFIVHGHDDGLKNSVARFLTSVGLTPVILHELPNRGRTIIEKFIDHSDVGFAVVLLTADDKGGSATTSTEDFVFRARQNVVMELGFFLGRLGRDRVAAIYDERVEMPSDYKGVLFLPHDKAGMWQHLLVKEIKAAGIPVDANKLYRTLR